MPQEITTLDPIELLPLELAAALEADGFFEDIPVIVADEGNIEQMIADKQAAIAEKCKRTGVSVVILQIIGDDDTPDLVSGPMTLYPGFEIVEQRALNRDVANGGTGKTARKVARRIIKIIKPLMLEGIVEGLQPDHPTLVPVPRDKETPANLIRLQVNFKCFEADADDPAEIVATPVAVQSDDHTEITLNCATPGAQIYYTLDDSFPSPKRMSSDNATGTFLYGGNPIAVPQQGFYIRARAYAPETIASGVYRAFIDQN